MSAPISSTHNNTISPSIVKWIVASSGVLVLFALGTLIYLAHRRRTQGIPSDEESHISDIRLPPPRPRLATKIAFPVSGIPRGHPYVHTSRGVPSPSTSAALGAMPHVRRDKAPGVSVLSPGSRLALV